VDATKAGIIATLRRVPLFTDLSQTELSVIAERVTRHQFEAGSIIYSEDDLCRGLFIVGEGHVKLFKSAANGRQQLIGIERPGGSLTEIPVFDSGRYPVTACASTTTVLLRLDSVHFREICLQYPRVALKVIEVLVHRLRSLGKLVEDLSFGTVRDRLIAYLVEMAEREGRRAPRGIEFQLTENNEALAARLGTVRELISRNLGRLHGEGLIQMERRTVIIPNLANLKDKLSRSA
jgi:CRP/FNR family transcriptional regulator, cyclic AMP receptor protein